MLKRLLIAGAITFVPGAAVAGTLSITFDLSTSTIVIPTPSSPPVVTETRSVSGQVVLTLDGVDASGRPLGEDAVGRLTGFSLSAVFGGPLGASFLGRRLEFTQGQVATSEFDGTRLVAGGLAGSVLSTPFCTGPICASIDPIGPLRFSFDAGAGFSAALMQLDQPGAAMLAASLLFPTLDSALLLQIRGTEVARGFAPEPGAAALLALALAALAGRRLRRREPEGRC